VIRLDELVKVTDNPQNPCYFRPYPTDPSVLRDEIEELIELASLRDDPEAVFSTQYRRERKQVSPFLQLRPQPIGAVVNTERDPLLQPARAGRLPEPGSIEIARGEELNPAFPVVRTGRELARYFESETPGLAHRLALNALIREQNWSPPRQALVWAALDVTIYSALLAAWYYKWAAGVGLPRCGTFTGTNGRGPGTSYRPRPVEMDYRVNVLYNRMVNETGSGDNGRRLLPDPSPGTPRHPAYPSGHSTYSAAASELLSFFFPDYTEEFDRLADNAGIARLWAGIHWRSDHCEGAKLGRCVARLVIAQLQRSCICMPDPCPPEPDNCTARPPTEGDLKECAAKLCDCCREPRIPRGCIDLPDCQPEARAVIRAAADQEGAPPGEEGEQVREGEAAGGGAGGTSDEALREQAAGPQEGAAAPGSSQEQRDTAAGPQEGARGRGSQRGKGQAKGPQEGAR
jgi:hypothetical protein